MQMADADLYMKFLIKSMGLSENFVIFDARADSELVKELNQIVKKERNKQRFRESLNVYSQKCLPKPVK